MPNERRRLQDLDAAQTDLKLSVISLHLPQTWGHGDYRCEQHTMLLVLRTENKCEVRVTWERTKGRWVRKIVTRGLSCRLNSAASSGPVPCTGGLQGAVETRCDGQTLRVLFHCMGHWKRLTFKYCQEPSIADNNWDKYNEIKDSSQFPMSSYGRYVIQNGKTFWVRRIA